MDNVIERLLKQKNERISDLENENKALWIINDEIWRLNENLIEENKKLKAEIEIRKLTAKNYAKQCWVELDDNLDDIIKKDE